jgi:hypothetical protein
MLSDVAAKPTPTFPVIPGLKILGMAYARLLFQMINAKVLPQFRRLEY